MLQGLSCLIVYYRALYDWEVYYLNSSILPPRLQKFSKIFHSSSVMASTQLLLNEKCTARLPVLSLNPHMTADVVRKEFTLPLLVHILASERLRQDVDCFIERGPYKQKGMWSIFCTNLAAMLWSALIQIVGVVRQFAISAHHHLVILLGPTLVTLSEGLWGYRSVRASDQYLDGEIPTIGSLLDQAVDSLFGLRNSWESVVEMLAYNFPVSTGSVVPTASPRELLIRLLVNQPSILEKIATGGDTVLSKLLFGPHVAARWPHIHEKEI